MEHHNRYRARRIRRFRSERGAALLLVLWLGAFFGIVLSAFAFSMRTELDAVRNFKEAAEASYLAKAGIARAFADLVNSRAKQGNNAVSFLPYRVGPVSLGRGTYEVMVIDEESRISLTVAPSSVLRRLLENTGVNNEHLVDKIVSSILDWRDHDDDHGQSGSEMEYYRSLPVPYSPRNGPFEVLEEVLLVEGMTQEIFYGNVRDPNRLAALMEQNLGTRGFLSGEYLGIRSLLTVHGSGEVDPYTASLDVLVASGLPDPQAREIILKRAIAPLSDQTFPAPVDVPWTFKPRAYKIESIGKVNGSPIVSRIVATLENEETPEGTRLKVIAWQDAEE